jgi:hypothetical protein
MAVSSHLDMTPDRSLVVVWVPRYSGRVESSGVECGLSRAMVELSGAPVRYSTIKQIEEFLSTRLVV